MLLPGRGWFPAPVDRAIKACPPDVSASGGFTLASWPHSSQKPAVAHGSGGRVSHGSALPMQREGAEANHGPREAQKLRALKIMLERSARPERAAQAPPADAWACWAEGGTPKQTPETTPSARGGPGTRAPLRFPFPARCQWSPSSVRFFVLSFLSSFSLSGGGRARGPPAGHSTNPAPCWERLCGGRRRRGPASGRGWWLHKPPAGVSSGFFPDLALTAPPPPCYNPQIGARVLFVFRGLHLHGKGAGAWLDLRFHTVESAKSASFA